MKVPLFTLFVSNIVTEFKFNVKKISCLPRQYIHIILFIFSGQPGQLPDFSDVFVVDILFQYSFRCRFMGEIFYLSRTSSYCSCDVMGGLFSVIVVGITVLQRCEILSVLQKKSNIIITRIFVFYAIIA